MATSVKDSVIHWKKKLDRNPDEDVILNVIRKLSKVLITLDILQETHIGKCIRKLAKRDDIVGEKALAVLKKWRIAFANGDESVDKNKSKSVSVKENVNKESKESSKSSSKRDASREKTNHHQKETSHNEHKHKHQKNSSSNPSYPQSSKKYTNCNYNANSSGESSPSLYTYDKKEPASIYVSYDPHSDVSEGYNPECPDLFPGGNKYMKKKSDSVDTYEPSSIKRKLKEQSEYVSKSKKIKSENHSYSASDAEVKSSEEKKEKHSFHKEKSKNHKVNTQSSSIKKESNGIKPENGLKKKSSSDSKKSKNKEGSENRESKSKAKLKINCTEEFTPSEVSFEDCLSFNDIVIKKKKTPKGSSFSASKGPITMNNKLTNVSHSQKEKVPKDIPYTQKNDKFCINIPKPKDIPKIEVDIMSTLPQTLPNYRPLPDRSMDSFSKKKEVLTNEEAILFMSSKREKTAVYSGRKSYYTEVPTLFECCTRILIENIDAIEYMGEMPYFLLKPVLERCNPLQLYSIENFNPHLLEDTNELWEIHCKRDYRLLSPEESETWRDLYLRAQEERERKLKSVTANISASMSKSNPVRQVKLAYVDSVVKPPRDVARKQAKNGTALPVSHPVKAGPATKANPRPVAPVINSAATSAASTSYALKKPKVAPLMAKTLKSMKQCFRRK